MVEMIFWSKAWRRSFLNRATVRDTESGKVVRHGNESRPMCRFYVRWKSSLTAKQRWAQREGEWNGILPLRESHFSNSWLLPFYRIPSKRMQKKMSVRIAFIICETRCLFYFFDLSWYMKDHLKRIVTNRKLISISGAFFERNEKIVLNCDVWLLTFAICLFWIIRIWTIKYGSREIQEIKTRMKNKFLKKQYM